MNSEPIYVAQSKFGKGVFAKRIINKGELICVMRGKRIKENQFNQLTEKGRSILVDPLQVGSNDYLNLDTPYLYFNHSCNPNAGLKNATKMVALATIQKDDEIFFDYSTTWLEGFKCDCENKTCRKYIGDYFSIPLQTRKKYKRLGILPNFVTKLEEML